MNIEDKIRIEAEDQELAKILQQEALREHPNKLIKTVYPIKILNLLGYEQNAQITQYQINGSASLTTLTPLNKIR